MDLAEGSAVLDGRTLESERHDATLVSISAVDGNPITQTGGRFDTYACGLWVQLESLTPGRHDLSIRGSSGAFAISVEYRLTVSTSVNVDQTMDGRVDPVGRS